jgi:DNA invertase Pin-like site-specific DNA recombinase
MTSLGYARTSTAHQSLDQQLDALRAAGAEKIFTDQMPGFRDDRPGLIALLDYAREGDTVIVVALDRLGRSLTSVIATIDDLQHRSIVLRSLRESVDFSTSVGRMVAGIFASLAEYERTLINERAAAARTARQLRGKSVGRPRKLSDDLVRQAQALRSSGESIADICNLIGVGRSTLYRALAAAA